MTSLRIRNATIVTQDDARRVVEGDLFVEDGRVTHVGSIPGRKEADHTLDGTGQVVLPGLINLHTHLAMTLLRGYGDDLRLEEWLQTRIWPAEARIDAEAMRAGVRLGILELLRGGTTSFLDMYWMESDVLAPECRTAGIRAWAGEGMVDIGQTPDGEPNKKLGDIERFVKATARPGKELSQRDLVTGCPAPHGTYTCNEHTLRESGRIANDHGVPLHIHMAETRTEVHDVESKTGHRPVARLAQCGGLGEHTVAAHGGWLTKDECRQVGQAKASVAHCPVSNLKLATGGVCPVPELQEAGVTVGLGTDGPASNNTMDLFQSMKFAALVQKNHRWDARVLPAQAVLDMATRNGADALHRPDLGRITPGATADLCMVDFRKPHLVPRHDAVSHLVYAAGAPDVSATIVAGRLVMQNGAVSGYDSTTIMAEAQRQAQRLHPGTP